MQNRYEAFEADFNKGGGAPSRRRTGRFSRVTMQRVAGSRPPQGRAGTSYEIDLPLDPDGQIDATSWLDRPDQCRVKRLRDGEAGEVGRLARDAHGRWYFDYGAQEKGGRHRGLTGDRFHVGQFIGLVEDDGDLQTYRIVSIEPVPGA